MLHAVQFNHFPSPCLPSAQLSLEIFFWSHQIYNALCDLDSLFILQMTFFASYSSHCSSAVELIFHLLVCCVDTNFIRKTPTTSVLKKIARHAKRIIAERNGKKFCTCCFCGTTKNEIVKTKLHYIDIQLNDWMTGWVASESLEIFFLLLLLRMIYLDLVADMCYIARICDD